MDMRSSGTGGHASAGLWLDSMTLKAFSNPNDPVIPGCAEITQFLLHTNQL